MESQFPACIPRLWIILMTRRTFERCVPSSQRKTRHCVVKLRLDDVMEILGRMARGTGFLELPGMRIVVADIARRKFHVCVLDCFAIL